LTASAKTSEIKKVKSEKFIKAEQKISKSKLPFFVGRLIQSDCGTWDVTVTGNSVYSDKFLRNLCNFACKNGWTSFTYSEEAK